MRAELTVPGTGWVWRGDGANKPKGRGAELGDSHREPYAAVTLMGATHVINGQCKELNPASIPLSQQPEVAARQVAGIRGVRVETAPTPTQLSGYPAVHVVLSVPRLCPHVNDIVLWGLSNQLAGGHNGVASVTHAGQRMDVWLVDVDGTMLIVFSELSPGLPSRFRAETQALLDSIVLTPVED